MQTEQSPLEKLGDWIRNSVMLKLISITILMLLLLIPASMVQSIIEEREQLRLEATEEVSAKWARAQTLQGPILTIPLVYEKEKDDQTVEYTQYLHLLPERLDIAGEVTPQTLRRGIYEVVVYESVLRFQGQFLPEFRLDERNLKEIRWKDAFLTIGISDLRGIRDQLVIAWGKEERKVHPGSRIQDLIPTGVTVELPGLQLPESGKALPFAFEMRLQGSENLAFVPVGGQTSVRVASEWDSPSFNGNFLPQQRDVSDSGFTAEWNVLQLNRNFPQHWIGSGYASELEAAAFGVNLLVPLDDYQKSLRSAKYGVMTIALTFLIFFLVEIINGQKIHPFQYTLVGLALCLFYVLLVSISEHSSFNLAYVISTLSIVLIICGYALSIFRVRKLVTLLVATLLAIYGFLFVTLQLADYALLLGSVGLTLILAATMYFTRNIDWYRLAGRNNPPNP